jgi:CrcB protein
MPQSPHNVHPRWPQLWAVAAVFTGGMIGTMMRFGFNTLRPTPQDHLPWTTLAENVLGAFLLGWAVVVLLERMKTWRSLHPLVCTGVLGSFTTFSNLSFEATQLATGERPWLAIAYPLLSIALGLAAATLGVAAGRRGTAASQEGKA